MRQTEKVTQDISKPFWSIDQAALHFGVRRATIRQYIRDGLPTYFDGLMVKPAEAVAEWLKRKRAREETRNKLATRRNARNDDLAV